MYPPNTKRPQFTLGRLMLLVTIAGLAAAWVGYPILKMQRIEEWTSGGASPLRLNWTSNPPGRFWSATTYLVLWNDKYGWDVSDVVMDVDLANVNHWRGLAVTGQINQLSLDSKAKVMLSDEHVEHLCRAKLRQLNLTRVHTSRENYIKMNSLGCGVSIDLSNTDVNDADIDALSRLSNLGLLTLCNTAVTDEAIVRLQMQLPALIVRTAEDLGSVGGMSRPSTNDLRSTTRGKYYVQLGPNASKASLEWLQREAAQKQSVNVIEILDSPITDDAMPFIGDFSEIRALRISSPLVTDEGLQVIGQYCGLLDISLTTPRITGRCFEALRQCSQLTSIEINGATLDDNAVTNLVLLPPLKRLRLNECTLSHDIRNVLEIGAYDGIEILVDGDRISPFN